MGTYTADSPLDAKGRVSLLLTQWSCIGLIWTALLLLTTSSPAQRERGWGKEAEREGREKERRREGGREREKGKAGGRESDSVWLSTLH